MIADAKTIYAPATGPGRAGIAVIRISGPAADDVLRALTRRPLPEPRRAALRRLRRGGALIDEALVLRFEAGASFTGEAMAELHVHGGRAVQQAVLDAIEAVPGTRLAEPGEFTLRAFRNGRIDLAEVEALGDLLAAETEAQRAQAAALLGGALHRRAEAWRATLTRALSLVEVTIDWADEEVPEDVGPEVGDLICGVAREIRHELAVSEGAERVRSGLEVALVGAPNAGKSSLLNALAGREAAITSPHPGTTRDVVELRYDLSGLPVVFLDTAGLRAARDEIEAEGVSRAWRRAEGASLRVLLSAPDAPLPEEAVALRMQGDIEVRTKADLVGCAGGGLAVSAVTGEGLDGLLAALRERLSGAAGGGLVVHRRQRQALATGAEALETAAAGLDSLGPELVSEEVRRAVRALERLIGRIDVENVLDEVFGSFCLGK
jgi:tRNA modification GTPase